MTDAISYNKNKPVVPLPQSDLSKKGQVAGMFNNISKKYDFLNHFLSLGIDRNWRKKTIHALKDIAPKQILDVATGTGDLAIEALKLQPDLVTGIDISEGMLGIGRKKLVQQGLEKKIDLRLGDSESLDFKENYFDAITCAYGVRNFENLEKGLQEMYRVLRPGGKAAILEFSKPQNFPVKQLYAFYFKNILPFFGKLVSKDATAYTYLHDSAVAFPDGESFCEILKKTGFSQVTAYPLTFGITTLYVAAKV